METEEEGFPVYEVSHVKNVYGTRVVSKERKLVAYVRKSGQGAWRFRLADDKSRLDHWKIFRSRADAESAARVDYAERELRLEYEARMEELRGELARARDQAKAQMDFGLCLDVVSAYRGPCGERWDVVFRSAHWIAQEAEANAKARTEALERAKVESRS